MIRIFYWVIKEQFFQRGVKCSSQLAAIELCSPFPELLICTSYHFHLAGMQEPERRQYPSNHTNNLRFSNFCRKERRYTIPKPPQRFCHRGEKASIPNTLIKCVSAFRFPKGLRHLCHGSILKRILEATRSS